MPGKILVIGGTGMLGRPVAERLKTDGFDVTIMSSNAPKAEEALGGAFKVQPGDVTDIESLKTAIKGNEFVFMNLSAKLDSEKYESIEIGGTANVANVATEMGVKRVGMISGASSKGEENGVIYLDAKVKAEKALMSSGVPYTIMRPSWFFESLPMFIQQGRAAILGEQPLKIGWLAASNYAKQVSASFQTEDAANKCFYNLGPEKMTMMEALTRFATRHYPDLTPETVSFTAARLIAYMPGMNALKLAIPFFEYFAENDENVDPSEANQLLGTNETTIEQWLEGWQKPSR